METLPAKKLETMPSTPDSSALGNETYIFDLMLENSNRQRDFGRGEMAGLSRVSQITLCGKTFILSEMGQTTSREYVLKEIYAVAQDVFAKYSPNKLSIGGSVVQSVRRGLEIKFETDGEVDMRILEIVEKHRANGMNIGPMERPKDVIDIQ